MQERPQPEVAVPVDPMAHFNQTSVEALRQLGVADTQIFSVLSSLRQSKNYTSVGEVEKALDWINREQARAEQQHQHQVDVLLKESFHDYEMTYELTQKEAVQLVKQKSLGKPKSDVLIELTKSQPFVFAWGDNSFAKLGLDPRLAKVPRPTALDLTEPVVQLACGPDHALCITKSGTVY